MFASCNLTKITSYDYDCTGAMFLDIYTLRWVAVVFYAVFFVLMLLLWRRNLDYKGWRFWMGFTVLITVEAALSVDPAIRTHPIITYFGNAMTVFGYYFLLIGCIRFTGTKFPKKILWALAGIIVLTSTVGYLEAVPRGLRIWGNISFIVVALALSLTIIAHWRGVKYPIVRYFLVFWMATHLVAFVIRVAVALSANGDVSAFYNSWTLLFLVSSNAFILMGIHLLVTGRRREQLEQEITGRLEAEVSAVKAMEMADVANEAKSRFLANMSHEFRTPLNAIIGFADILKKHEGAEKHPDTTEYLTYIQSSGDTLLRLVNDVLDFASYEVGEVQVHPVKTDIVALSEEIVRMYKPLAKNRQIDVQYVDHGIVDVEVEIDPLRLKQVIGNLITNAIKYGRQGGYVRLELKQEKNKILLYVIDNGIGISEEKIDEIFKPFNRAGKEALAIDGMGLGLSISRYLARVMNCEIGVKSIHDRGSEFWVSMPLK